MSAKPPLYQFHAGPIGCAVWKNQINAEGKTRYILQASVDRRYMDKSGVFRSTHSFSLADIPLVVYVLRRAFDAMVQESAEETTNTPTEQDSTDMPTEQKPE